jgi:hypothetical protein
MPRVKVRWIGKGRVINSTIGKNSTRMTINETEINECPDLIGSNVYGS